jgi:hypothetical protein
LGQHADISITDSPNVIISSILGCRKYLASLGAISFFLRINIGNAVHPQTQKPKVIIIGQRDYQDKLLVKMVINPISIKNPNLYISLLVLMLHQLNNGGRF